MPANTKADLLALIQAELPDNNAELIKASDVRNVFNQIVENISQNEKVLDIEQYGATEGADATAAVQSAIASLNGKPGKIECNLERILLGDIQTTAPWQFLDFSRTVVEQRNPNEDVFWVRHPFTTLFTNEITNSNGRGTGSHVVHGNTGEAAFGCRFFVRSRFAAKHGFLSHHGSHAMGFISVYGAGDDGINFSVSLDFDNNHFGKLITTSSLCYGYGISLGKDNGAVDLTKNDNWRGSGGDIFSKCYANRLGAMFMGGSDNIVQLFSEQHNDVICEVTYNTGDTVLDVQNEGGNTSFQLDHELILDTVLDRITVGSLLFGLGDFPTGTVVTAVDAANRQITVSNAATGSAVNARVAMPRVGSEAIPGIEFGHFARANDVTLVGDKVDTEVVIDNSQFGDNSVRVRRRNGGLVHKHINIEELFFGKRIAQALDGDFSNTDPFAGFRAQMRPRGGAVEFGPFGGGTMDFIFAPRRIWKQAKLVGDSGAGTATLSFRDLSVYDGSPGWLVKSFSALLPDDVEVLARREMDNEIDVTWPDTNQNMGVGDDVEIWLEPETPTYSRILGDYLRLGGIAEGEQAQLHLINLPKGTTEAAAVADGAELGQVYRGSRDGILRLAQNVQNSSATAHDVEGYVTAVSDADAAAQGVPVNFAYKTPDGFVRYNTGVTPTGSTPPPSAVSTNFNQGASSSSLNFSNGNRTVNSQNSNFNTAVSDIIADKTYFEVQGLTNDVIFGVANNTINPTGSVSNWTASGSWGVRRDGSVYNTSIFGPGPIDSAGISTFPSDVGRVWFDPTAGDMWVAFGPDVLGGGDPIAGTNPTFSGMTGSDFRAVVHTRSTTATTTINLDAADFQYSPDSVGGNTITTDFDGINGSVDYGTTNPLAPLASNEVLLLIFGGQSNMQGGTGQDLAANGGQNLTAQDLRETYITRRWVAGSGTSGSWGPFTIADNFGAQKPHGPDIFLMQQERELGIHTHPARVVKYTVGGTPITQFMSGGQYNQAFKDEIRGAVNALVAEGYSVRPVIFWHQGETQDVPAYWPANQQSNAAYPDSQTSANDHENNLNSLIAELRAMFNVGGTGDVPFVMGELWDRPFFNGDFNHITTINNAINNIAATDTHSHVLATKALSTYDDVHFDSASQIIFGDLCADALRTISKPCLVTSAI